MAPGRSEWRRRADDPPDLNGSALRNGWASRIRAAGEVLALLEKPGVLSIVLIAVFLALYMGYLPSPLGRVEAKIDGHEAHFQAIVAVRTKIDERLTHLIEAMERRERLRVCAEITDRDLRAECLR